MRLLNASTLKLHEFFGDSIPPYAILSHRWEEQEVTFQDLQDGRGHRMKGWSKIIGCCQQAVEDGFEYAWIDSCCIDKSSSAELSEAINSMYSWYEAAVLCYAYLSDVRISSHYFDSREYPFSCSQWFTRGWTLQELLAPEMVIFFDMHWKEIGTKATLANDIKTITGIDDLNAIHSASVAQKMSWAARRETTRIEDRAYSLMGLFNVNMPTLYGEGERAFLRLQQEIIRTTEDQSIFAWTSHQRWSGLLARSPSSFIDSGDILWSRRRTTSKTPHYPPHSMTNRGLNIEMEFLSDSNPPAPLGVIALLDCYRLTEPDTRLAVYLSNLTDGGEKDLNIFFRAVCSSLPSLKPPQVTSRKAIYIRQDYFARRAKENVLISFRTLPLNCRVPLSDRYPTQNYYWADDQDGPKLSNWSSVWDVGVTNLGSIASLMFRNFEVPFVLIIAIFHDRFPTIDIQEPNGSWSLDHVASEARREDYVKAQSRTITDRAYLRLGQSERVLVAVLKKKMVAGTAGYVVEFSTVINSLITAG